MTTKQKLVLSFKISLIITLIAISILIIYLTKQGKYEKSRDEIITSPSGKYQITLRYDYTSSPYIFKDNKLIFETNKPGFNETVNFKVKWESENEILLYIDSEREKYKDEKYYIKID